MFQIMSLSYPDLSHCWKISLHLSETIAYLGREENSVPCLTLKNFKNSYKACVTLLVNVLTASNNDIDKLNNYKMFRSSKRSRKQTGWKLYFLLKKNWHFRTGWLVLKRISRPIELLFHKPISKNDDIEDKPHISAIFETEALA